MKNLSGALFLLVFALQSFPARAMTDAQEISLGKRVSRDAEQKWGGALPAADPLSQRVRRIGAPLARFSSRRNIPYSYKVLKNDRILNAFAAPGGPIYITRRLLNLTANDAELSSILSHETAHIDRRHMVKMIEKRERAQQSAGELGDQLLGKGKGKRIIALSTDVVFAVWSRGYSRDNESEADAWGTRWISRLGYDPRASISILGKINRGQSDLNEVGKYLSSHPAPSDRRTALNRLIAREKLLDVAREHGGPKMWSDDGAFPTKGEELARRSNNDETDGSTDAPTKSQTATTSKASSVSKTKPETATAEILSSKNQQTKPSSSPKASTPTTKQNPATPKSTSIPQASSTKGKSDDVTASSSVPIDVVVVQEKKAENSSSLLPILFACGAIILLISSLYFWFVTQPRSNSETTAAIFQSTPAVQPVNLVLTTSQGNRYQFPLLPDSSILIGRDSTCDFCLTDSQASHHHAEIRFDGRNHAIIDLNSTNGTQLNGCFISSTSLSEGDTIQIGQNSLYVESLD